MLPDLTMVTAACWSQIAAPEIAALVLDRRYTPKGLLFHHHYPTTGASSLEKMVETEAKNYCQSVVAVYNYVIHLRTNHCRYLCLIWHQLAEQGQPACELYFVAVALFVAPV